MDVSEDPACGPLRRYININRNANGKIEKIHENIFERHLM